MNPILIIQMLQQQFNSSVAPESTDPIQNVNTLSEGINVLLNN